MPSILKLREAYKDKGLTIVFVSVDEKPETVLPASLKSLGIDFTTYVDPDQKLAELFDEDAAEAWHRAAAERAPLVA